ncbi:cytochrome-c oxidase, cbb3-type subunit III [Agarilytica rhodophyticola]|uniref:cytochrome-c oxidase, cbb3-type subunit III n=1 Tax=Agarilytica rhodophyticola TaxID=1737490 RepID=UPI000B341694|nr:cytochrome-c oxidase, cbb3-type subunit III [Agarilytica rhodophyticola]
MTLFWQLWIFILTATCLGLIFWVLMANRKVALRDDEDPENKTTGHVYDGIEEYDNPLPKWWFQLFLGSMVWALVYLVWYPGVWDGFGGWTSVGELKAHQEKAVKKHVKSYGVFSQMPVEELIHDNRAMKMGVRLFANNCAVCHGADGGGNFGIPNLTDGDWLYGGTPDTIKHTLLNGRAGNMPAWGPILGEEKISHIAEYVLQLSGQEHTQSVAAIGKTLFDQNCSACHGADGKGMAALGAPNLTDDVWLYDGSREGILHSIRNGLANEMPAQKDLLREEKIHILTAYVYSLSFDYE